MVNQIIHDIFTEIADGAETKSNRTRVLLQCNHQTGVLVNFNLQLQLNDKNKYESQWKE